ncbi:MAG: tetratricopeptide repeat protein, partial [Armatimonadetes bacterium]|nr:tetratricopeptide repeat protein [Armatimonadota bacterium]
MWVRIVALLLGSLALRPSVGAAIPMPLDAIDAAAADALAAAVAGPLRPDPAVQKLGDEILAYADRADGLTLRFTPVETPSSTALVLPNGSIYLSTKTLELLRGDVEKTSFVLASLGALAIDGGARDSDAVCEVVDRGGALPASFVQTVEATLTPERLYQADRLAMLCLARAGMPPLEGVRAIDDLARAGVRWTTTPKLPGVPTLLERKVKASQAAADLIKAATEFDFAVMDLVEKRYEDAIPRFKTFLEILPNNYAGWNNLGLCHYHLAIEPLGPPRFLLADAVAEFDTSYFTRGKRAPDDEHWQAALAAYQKASRLDPLRVEALINLGNLYLVTRDYQKGRHYFDLVLAQQPRNATALNNYGVALAEETAGDFPAEALAKFSSAAEADPTLPEAQFNLGLARAELG